MSQPFADPFANPFAKLPGFDSPVENGIVLFPELPTPCVVARPPDAVIDLAAMGELVREWITEVHSNLTPEGKTKKAWLFTPMFRMLTNNGFTAFGRDAMIFLATEFPKTYHHDGVRKSSAAMRSFMRWLVATGRIERPIGEYVRFGKGKVYPKKDPITQEDYVRLKAASKLPELTWLLIVGWHTGFACIDAATLTWEEVDMRDCVIRKPREKTGILMTNYFDAAGEFGKALRAKHAHASLNNAIPSGPVEPRLANRVRPVHGPTGPWNAMPSLNRTGYLRVMLRDLFAEACISNKGFHCFRTRWCTTLVNNGVSLTVAAQTTGHKSVNILSGYVRPDATALKAASAIAVSVENRVASNAPLRPDPEADRVKVGCIYFITVAKPKLSPWVWAKYIIPTKIPEGESEIVGIPCDVDGDRIHHAEVTVPRWGLRYVGEVTTKGETQ